MKTIMAAESKWQFMLLCEIVLPSLLPVVAPGSFWWVKESLDVHVN